jgi:hypothetical protein
MTVRHAANKIFVRDSRDGRPHGCGGGRLNVPVRWASGFVATQPGVRERDAIPCYIAAIGRLICLIVHYSTDRSYRFCYNFTEITTK